MAQGYSVNRAELDKHLEIVRERTRDLYVLADVVASLGPISGPSWTGTEGGAKLLRECLTEVAEALRLGSGAVSTYGARAVGCAARYDRVDQAGAEAIRKCVIDAGR